MATNRYHSYLTDQALSYAPIFDSIEADANNSTPFQASHKSLAIDPSSLIPSILAAITGKYRDEIIELSQKIDAGKATKRDQRRLLKLLDRTHKRISN